MEGKDINPHFNLNLSLSSSHIYQSTQNILDYEYSIFLGIGDSVESVSHFVYTCVHVISTDPKIFRALAYNSALLPSSADLIPSVAPAFSDFEYQKNLSLLQLASKELFQECFGGRRSSASFRLFVLLSGSLLLGSALRSTRLLWLWSP